MAGIVALFIAHRAPAPVRQFRAGERCTRPYVAIEIGNENVVASVAERALEAGWSCPGGVRWRYPEFHIPAIADRDSKSARLTTDPVWDDVALHHAPSGYLRYQESI